jgi:hypothetical protein
MSLNKLSTELDENIVRRLARPELDALSRTSRYYSSLTEPYLYRNLVFSKYQAYEIQRLFLTILGRNELAKHIRSFMSDVVGPRRGCERGRRLLY